MVVGGVSTGHLLRDIADVQGQLVFKSLALHHDQYRDNEAGYDNCYDEDSDDNFDDGDDWIDLQDGGEEGLGVEEARQPHRDQEVEVCSPSFQLTVIIMTHFPQTGLNLKSCLLPISLQEPLKHL